MSFKKPEGYDEAEAKEFGERTELPPGGYVCEIKNAYPRQSKKGNQMMVLELDIAEGEYAGYISNLPENLQFQGRFYQLTEGASLPFFKGLIQAIERSNEGYKFDWGDPQNDRSLIGLQVCGVFGKEQYQSNMDGSLQWSTRLVRITTLEALQNGDVKPPKDKYLPGQYANTSPPPSNNGSFFEVDNNLSGDDLPF